MELINPDKETSDKLLKEVRKNSNSSETERIRVSRYGHVFTTIRYYKEGVPIARIFKTDGVVVQIDKYEEAAT